MKRLLVLSFMLLSGASTHATFAPPFGTEMLGAGSSFVPRYMNKLIARYSKSYSCPQIVYKQRSASLFAGSDNGIARVIDDSVTFAVSDNPLSEDSVEGTDCLLQIPFILAPLVIIYHLPLSFEITNPSLWQGYLVIKSFDLCTSYTLGMVWGSILGFQGAAVVGAPYIQGFARSDSCTETGLFVKYLRCASNPPFASDCQAFIDAPNVVSNPNGPFCNTSPAQWQPNEVTCLPSNDAIAQAVLATPGSIGYVDIETARAYGFLPGSPNGVPFGVVGLFITGSTAYTSPQTSPEDNPANYEQPTNALVKAAATDCTGGDYICKPNAYPIVNMELFVLKATQPVDLITCNIIQFIQYTLTFGQQLGALTPLPCECQRESLALLDQVSSAICEPCVPPCNPCLGQTCPLPSCLPPCPC